MLTMPDFLQAYQELYVPRNGIANPSRKGQVESDGIQLHLTFTMYKASWNRLSINPLMTFQESTSQMSI